MQFACVCNPVSFCLLLVPDDHKVMMMMTVFLSATGSEFREKMLRGSLHEISSAKDGNSHEIHLHKLFQAGFP